MLRCIVKVEVPYRQRTHRASLEVPLWRKKTAAQRDFGNQRA